MSDSDSLISIVTIDSSSDSDSMDNNVAAAGDLIAYSFPERSLRDIEKEVSGMKEGKKSGDKVVERPLSPTVLQCVIKKRAEKRGLPYELEVKDDEDEETRTKRIKETEKKRPVMAKGYLVRRQARDQAVRNEIQLLQYENDVLKAQVRQYRTKCRKMKRLAFTAIDPDDHLHETANVNMERHKERRRRRREEK